MKTGRRKAPKQTVRRYKEERVKSLRELKRTIESLEQDEGIRIEADVSGFAKGGFIFVNKSGGNYCVNICSRVYDHSLKAYVPGGKEDFHYFGKAEDVWKMIKGKHARLFRAFLY